MERKVKRIIIDKLGLNEKDYSEDSSFREDWGLDSLDLVDIIMECERQFNLSITDDAVGKMNCPKDLIKYIREHKK